MSLKEGKDLMRTCLEQIAPERNVDKLFQFKSGTKKHASEYQKQEVTINLTADEIDKMKKGIPYFVDYFIYFGVYAAWEKEVCEDSGKCIIHREDLERMEEDSDLSYKEVKIGDNMNSRLYFFRGEKGIKQFFNTIGLDRSN